MNLWYYGLADCHGLESFVHDVDDSMMDLFFTKQESKSKNSDQYAMCLRARENQQRHAVVYRVLLPEEIVKVIEQDLKDGNYQKALQGVKDNSIEVQMGTFMTTKAAAEKNWRMIPNPDLDPYHQ
jgi:hypothetical protein